MRDNEFPTRYPRQQFLQFAAAEPITILFLLPFDNDERHPAAMPPRSNLAVLTQSHNAAAAKKKEKREQIKEILFDDDARRCVLGRHCIILSAKDDDTENF